MIRFHFCRAYLKQIKGHPSEQRANAKFVVLSEHNRLVNSGALKDYNNGLYYLRTLSPVSKIIIQKVKVNQVEVHFVRHIYSSSDMDYYFKTYVNPSMKSGLWLEQNPLDDLDVTDFREEWEFKNSRKKSQIKPPPPKACTKWLEDFKLSVKNNVFETDEWVKYALSEVKDAQMKDRDVKLFAQLINSLFDDSQQEKIEDKKKTISTHNGIKILSIENDFVGIIYSRIKLPEGYVVLLYSGAHLSTQQDHWVESCSNVERLEQDVIPSFEFVCRISYKAYPKWTLRNDELWFAIQKNDEFSNLSLTQDQIEFFRGFRFPKYINGQAGSGKSTMLYYLFSNSYYSSCVDDNPGDVLFLTENESLLEHSRESVFDLLNNNPEFDGLTIDQVLGAEKHFSTFTNFLLNLVPSEDKGLFNVNKRLNYGKFKDLYLNSRLSQSIKRKYTAEESWFTIITYIYGYSSSDRITSSNYEHNVYLKSQKIPKDTFAGIETNVLPFYEKLISEQGYWDRLKLIRYLEANFTKSPKYSVIICDEAQDFCRVELRFILQLSEFLQYDLSNVSQIPIVIAGDPNQTVNPTGFREREMTEMLHKELQEESGFDFNKYDSVYNPMYNYRSKQPVVTLANFVQYHRKKQFDIRMVWPQIPKRPDSSLEPIPNYFFSSTSIERVAGLKEQLIDKIKYKVFIVPVDEDDKTEYVKNSSLLSEINKFEIKTSVESKGAEYNQVVVHGFGEYYLKHFGAIEVSERPVQNDETFRKAYFFNKLYVAVTRAQKELVIIDSEESLESFWKVLVDNCQIADANWKVLNDLRIKTIEYGPDTLSGLISSSLDDALTNAQEDKKQGKYDQNPARLVVAAHQFYKVGEKEEYYKCYALASEFRYDWSTAAEYYLRPELNRKELSEAARCYFNGRLLDDLIKEIGASLKTEEQDVRLIIVRLINDSNLSDDEITKLSEGKVVLRELLNGLEWRQEVLNYLVKLSKSNVSPGSLRELTSICEMVARDEDTQLWRSIGKLRFKLQDYEKAIDAWERCDFIETEEYSEAKIKFYHHIKDIQNEAIWLASLSNLKSRISDKIRIEEQIVEKIRLLEQKSEKRSPFFRLATLPSIAIHLVDSNFRQVIHNLEEDFIGKLNLVLEQYFNLLSSERLSPQIEDYLLLRSAKLSQILAIESAEPEKLWVPTFNKTWKKLNKQLTFNHNDFTMDEIEGIPAEAQELFLKPPNHLKNVSIRGFRRFEELELNNLGLFNLIVGDNNIGKTSVLEMLLFDPDQELFYRNLAFAYAERKNLSRIEDDATAEERYVIPRSYVNSFRTDSENGPIDFLVYEDRSSWNYQLKKLPKEEIEKLLEKKGGIDVNDYEGFVVKGETQLVELPIVLKNIKPQESLAYPLVPFGKGFSRDLAQAYSIKIDRVKTVREEFQENMKVFVPNISRILVDTVNGIITIEEEGVETAQELHQFGEGANKLFRILVQMTLNKGGRVLIDEVDAGIHHTRFSSFWTTLLNFAVLCDVQLFATTHNLECIKYFKEILSKIESSSLSENSRVISLKELPDKSIKAYTRVFEEFGYEVDNNMELRGE